MHNGRVSINIRGQPRRKYHEVLETVESWADNLNQPEDLFHLMGWVDKLPSLTAAEFRIHPYGPNGIYEVLRDCGNL